MYYDLNNVYQAIAAFNSQDSQASSNAAQWLGEFQKSKYAWSITDLIFAMDHPSYEATMFAAQTIRQKILFDFRELSQDFYTPLRESIMNNLSTLESKLSKHNSGVIMTQLAAALADLYLQVPDWNDFGVMLDRLIQMSSEGGTNILLTLLKIFPEELYNRHMRIGENRRSAVEKDLAEKTDVVIQFLEKICETNEDPEAQTKVISCLSSWLINKQCPTESLAQSTILRSILYALCLPECLDIVHDAASECLVNALYLVDDFVKHEKLALRLQSGIYETVTAFKSAIDKEDMEKIQNYARIYCELCESLLPVIAANPGRDFGDLRSLDLLIMVLQYHDISLAEMTFNIWYRLSEFLYQAEDNDFKELQEVFRPYVEKYIMALYKHCHLDDNCADVLEPRSDFAEFRTKAEESVKDVTFIIGSAELLKSITALLSTIQAGQWIEMEAALFLISCFVHNIVETNRETIPGLLEAIFQLPPNAHPMLLHTTAMFLGNLQDWFAGNDKYLGRSVEWLLSLMGANHQLLKRVADSVELICEKGYHHLNGYFEPIVGIISAIESAPLTDGQEMERASHHLLRACTHLINDLPGNEIATHLELLCARPLEYLPKINAAAAYSTLNQGLSSENKENTAATWQNLSQDPVLWLDRLAGVFRVLKPWQSQKDFKRLTGQTGAKAVSVTDPEAPWLNLATRVWKVVSSTMEQFQQKERIVEKCCRTIRFVIRSMGIQSIIFIGELADQVKRIYSKQPHSSFLYLASIIVDEYGVIEQVQPGLMELLYALSEHSFKLLNGSQNGLRDHPDTVDDLFRLVIRFAQRLPQKFFNEQISANTFECAIHGLELDHTDANRSVSKFVVETIEIAKKLKDGRLPSHLQPVASQLVGAQKIILNYGDKIVWHALHGAIFNLSNSLRKEMADIIFSLGELSKAKQTEWISEAVKNLPHDSGLSPTSQQLNSFKDLIIGATRGYEVHNFIRDLAKYYL
ncbi:exportin 1-like protein domain-containing protein [Ditylenchus destructor]|uniref:Exportin 1-like protein domain-containing protein n=1 Tax=Ditylenchus destructor TaxID=166010 RepID=A0AAD4R2K8_9BILA|nr:exportin 1-like protein domain-containing protein [Ditylenchus destructor]